MQQIGSTELNQLKGMNLHSGAKNWQNGAKTLEKCAKCKKNWNLQIHAKKLKTFEKKQ